MPSINKKIGYVLKRYPRFSETFVVNEIRAHEAAGLTIEIFSLLSPNDGYFQDGISRVRGRVTYLPAESLKAIEFWEILNQVGELIPDLWCKLRKASEEEARYVYQAMLLAREVRLRNIEHLHSHFASAATTVTRFAAFFAGVPYSFTAHAKDIYHETVRPEDLHRKLQDAEAVVTVSQYNLQFLRETFPQNTEHLQCVYNGLQLDSLPYESPKNRPLQIIAVGRLVEKKGFADLIDACAILQGRKQDFKCSIIGGGELEADLRAQIERFNLQSKVQLTGFLPQYEVTRQLRNAAVMAAPCVIGSDGNRDGLPTVLLEAMALGTPCVATDVTGIPEIVDHGVTGLMVPQHNPEALASAIELLLSDAELRIRLSQEARQRIEKEFDIRRNTARIRQIFLAAQQTTDAPQGVY